MLQDHMLALRIKLATIPVTQLKANFSCQQIFQTHLIIENNCRVTIDKARIHLVRLIKPVYILYFTIYGRFRHFKGPSSWKKSESRQFIFTPRDHFGLLQFRHLLLISFSASAQCGTCVFRREVFHCFSSPCLRRTSFSRSCHEPRLACAIRAHSVYVARCLHYSNNRRSPAATFVTFPSFCWTFTSSSRGFLFEESTAREFFYDAIWIITLHVRRSQKLVSY